MTKFIMNNYLIFLGFFFIALSQNTYGVVPNVPYKTVALPANNGAWVLCATEATTNAAYSIRLAPPSSVLSSPVFGKSVLGKTKSKNSGYGFVAALYDPTADKVYLDTECGSGGYACYAVDTFATGPSTKICVVILNPTYNDVIINVVATFTTESPFITNDLNSNPNFSNYAVSDVPYNETILINYKDFVTTAQLSKRYHRD